MGSQTDRVRQRNRNKNKNNAKVCLRSACVRAETRQKNVSVFPWQLLVISYPTKFSVHAHMKSVDCA